MYHYIKKKYALYTNIMCCQNIYEIDVCLMNSSLTYVNSIVLAIFSFSSSKPQFSLTQQGSLCFQVETIEGLKDLHIPPGTQPGENLKFCQLGVPDIKKPNVRGDHYFMIKVKIPKSIRFELLALSNSSGKDIVFTINNLTRLIDVFSNFSYFCFLD